MIKKIWIVLAFQLLLACGVVLAQSISSTILGSVVDSSGAVIPAAQVTVKNTETGIVTKATTNSRGTFSVPELQAGVYDVTVAKSGFDTFETTQLRVFSSVNARVDAVLKAGTVEQTVVVNGSSAMLDTDTMTVGGSISTRQLTNLPTSLQTVDSFVAMAPGVQTSGDATNAQIGGGSHWGSVNYTLNGVEVNDPGNSGAVTVQGVGLLVLPPPSSVQELKVQSNNMDVKSSGHSSVTLVTKAGTNAFHGMLYEYLRNTVLDANTFALNAVGSPRAPDHLNQFGGNIGGPILRKKAFFFFDYSGYRHSGSNNVSLTLPGMDMRQGNFSAISTQLYNPKTGQPFQGNQIPTGMFASQVVALLKYLPAPVNSAVNTAGLPSGGANYIVATGGVEQNVDAQDLRVDYNISSSDRVFGVFARRIADPWDSSTAYPATYGQGRYGYKDTTLSGTEVHTFNSTTLNDLRVAWGDYATKFAGQNQNLNPQTLFPQMPDSIARGLPTMTISGYTGMFHDYGTGFYTPRWNVEITDNFTHIQGRHTIEAGLDETGYKINSRVPSTGSATGSFAFSGKWTGNLGWEGPAGTNPHSGGNAFADFLLGDADSSTTPPVGAFASNVYSRDWGVYVQDTWQATPRLTLIYGLRYEYQSPWLYKTQTVTTFDMKNDKLVLPENSATPTLPQGQGGVTASPALLAAYPYETTQSIGLPLHYIQPDRNNFAPRVGFSFRPFEKTVLQGGFGIYYNFQPGFVGSRVDAYNPPWQLSSSQTFTSELPGKPKTPYLPDITFANPFPSTNTSALVSANPAITFLAWNFKNALTEEWNLTLEQQFGKSWTARASYVGHVGRNLPYNGGPINVPEVQIPNKTIQAQRPFQPFGAISETYSTGYENFNQMQFGIEKRLDSGFMFQAQYQFSKGLDDVATSGGPQQWHQPQLDYGNSTGLARHWLTFNYIYELPFGKGQRWLNHSGRVGNAIFAGWQLSGMTWYQGGLPFSVAYSQTGTSFTGWWPGRADRVPGVSLYAGRSHAHGVTATGGVPWFNTAAFAPPQPWTWGNSARDLLFGPGSVNWDMSGMKSFALGERLHLQARADFFNAFNHFNQGDPVETISDTRDGGTPVANAGKSVSGDGSPRRIQLSVNLKF